MMLFTTEWLQELFPKYQGDLNIKINAINTDSRSEIKNALFIPIVGDKFNGHNYVKQAIAAGAVAVIWDEEEKLPSFIPDNFPVFFTEDTTKGLQQIAKKYRLEINPTVIGITGSNGKTTTKDLVASILGTTFRTHYTQGNFNNEIGLPLTILTMPRDTQVMVLEMGMSGFGEIDLLSQIAQPDYGIITNIGESHIEYLGSRKGIATAKMEIQNGLKQDGILIIDGDEPLLEVLQNNEYVITCGFGKHNKQQIENTSISVDGTQLRLANGSIYNIPLYGNHHARNAIFAITIGEILGVTNENINKGLQQLLHTSMRFELIQLEPGYTIVNDAYNASPTSMIGAIEVLKQMEGFKKKVLVLGDIFELGDFTEKMHRSIATVIKEPISHLYTTGEHAKLITEEINNSKSNIKACHMETKEELVNDLQKHQEKGTIILFKASRGMAFETMINKLIKAEEG